MTFHRLSLTFHRLSVTFHRLSVTFHCLSVTFHCLSVTFDCLSLPFLDCRSSAFPPSSHPKTLSRYGAGISETAARLDQIMRSASKDLDLLCVHPPFLLSRAHHNLHPWSFLATILPSLPSAAKEGGVVNTAGAHPHSSRHQRDDATLSNLPACSLCAAPEHPPPARFLAGLKR